MKKLLFALLTVITLSAHAQTADEVIQKYSLAMGGLDEFKKVKTAKLTATLTTQGKPYPMTTQLVNGKSMRTDVTANGKEIINVYHNDAGWKINPYAGAAKVTDVSGTELVSFRNQTHLANSLMDYKSRGHQVELAGQELVEGKNTHKIKLTQKEDGKVSTYFIDANTYMLVKSISTRETAGREFQAETFYYDFKAISGLKFCHHFVQKIDNMVFQEVQFSTIELNVPVDEKIMVKPQ